jgi:hypothetical protein
MKRHVLLLGILGGVLLCLVVVLSLNDKINRSKQAADAKVTVAQLEAQALMRAAPGSRESMEAGERTAEEAGGIAVRYAAATGEDPGLIVKAAVSVGALMGAGPQEGLEAMEQIAVAGQIGLQTVIEGFPHQLAALKGRYTPAQVAGFDVWAAPILFDRGEGPQTFAVAERLMDAMAGGGGQPGGPGLLLPGWQKMSMAERFRALMQAYRRDKERVISLLAPPGQSRGDLKALAAEADVLALVAAIAGGAVAHEMPLGGRAGRLADEAIWGEIMAIPGQHEVVHPEPKRLRQR